MAQAQMYSRRTFFVRMGILIGACTLFLTASFFGIIAVLNGDVQNLAGHLPWYLVVAALTFVATVVLLEENGSSGQTIIVTAVVTTLLGLTTLTLAVEGIMFVMDNRETILLTDSVLYLFSAGLIATGLGYWGLNHWREFADSPNDRL